MTGTLGIDTPLGRITVQGDDTAVTRIGWTSAPDDPTALLVEAGAQIAAYFAGRLDRFDLPMRIEASPIQQAACAAMAAIPFGETRTYGEIARSIGVSAQAAGQLCGGNPLPIVVPCHRVLSATGLGGFSAPGGVEAKVWLLRHEGAAGLLI